VSAPQAPGSETPAIALDTEERELIRSLILADPELVLSDDMVMRALLGATAQGARNIVDLRDKLVERLEQRLHKLVRRPEGALLSGLWELPTSPENGARDQLVALLAALGPELASALPDEPSATVRHSITDRRIRALVYDVRLGAGLRGDARRVAEAEAAAWVTSDELSGYGASSLVAKALRSLGGSS
jgi:adenine-specific DNA glycosylase